MNGTEMLLKSMGLGDVIDMAKQFATDGTLQKILTFADNLEALNAKLEKIVEAIPAIEALVKEQGFSVSVIEPAPSSGGDIAIPPDQSGGAMLSATGTN